MQNIDNMNKEEINYRIIEFVKYYNNNYKTDINIEDCCIIPKKDLIVGQEYNGICRNSIKAIWNGKEFEYKRFKIFEFYTDTINHYEDDDGYDVFVPVMKSSHED